MRVRRSLGRLWGRGFLGGRCEKTVIENGEMFLSLCSKCASIAASGYFFRALRRQRKPAEPRRTFERAHIRHGPILCLGSKFFVRFDFNMTQTVSQLPHPGNLSHPIPGTTSTNDLMSTRSKSKSLVRYVSDQIPTMSAPIVGHIYTIQSATTGHFLNINDCSILSPTASTEREGRADKWRCTRFRGWRGFQSLANNRFLCLDDDQFLWADHSINNPTRRFVIDPQHDGSIVLKHEQDGYLYPVAWRTLDDGTERLTIMKDASAIGYAFKFTKIH